MDPALLTGVTQGPAGYGPDRSHRTSAGRAAHLHRTHGIPVSERTWKGLRHQATHHRRFLRITQHRRVLRSLLCFDQPRKNRVFSLS